MELGYYPDATFDKTVTLTARISIPGLAPYNYDIDVKALGVVPIPQPGSIELYFNNLIGHEITKDIYLPGKYNEADVKGIQENVISEDIVLEWNVFSGDESVLVDGNQIIRQDHDINNLTLSANLFFDGNNIVTIY